MPTAAAPNPLGDLPAHWIAHEWWSWEANVADDHSDTFNDRTLTTAGGWVSCSCGFQSTPRNEADRIPPLPYYEAMRAYIDHLPEGMARWLDKRNNAPRDDADRVHCLKRLVDAARENNTDLLDRRAVEEILGIYR